MDSHKYLKQWLLQNLYRHGLKGLWSDGGDFSRSRVCKLIVVTKTVFVWGALTGTLTFKPIMYVYLQYGGFGQ